ncbi:MAG: hypothetical protein GY853_10400 [PVC group bacterium]|nr:hypothetical protein [PVC group bacterium]
MDEIIEERKAFLISRCPPIEAFGIGGSYKSEISNSYSDLDFFIFTNDNNFFDFKINFIKNMSHPLNPISVSGPTFHVGFGFCYSFIFTNYLVIEYYLNCQITYDYNPMRENTTILYDPNNFIEAKLHNKVKESDSVRLNYKKIIHDYIDRLFKIRKVIYKRDLVHVFYQLNKLRFVLFGTLKYTHSNIDYFPDYSDVSTKKYLSNELYRNVTNTFCGLDVREMLKSFILMRGQFKTNIDNYFKEYRNEIIIKMESDLSEEIINGFREL